jgi:hypothetical protein
VWGEGGEEVEGGDEAGEGELKVAGKKGGKERRERNGGKVV